MKKTAYIPALRVTESLAKRIFTATEHFGLSFPAIRRMIWEEYSRISEKGEHLATPVRLLTVKEDLFMKECLRSCGLKSVDEFFHECVDALKTAKKNGYKMHRPLEFTREERK